MFTPFPQNSVPDTVSPPDWFQIPPHVDAPLFLTWLDCSEHVPPDLYHAPPVPPDSFSSTVQPDSVSEPDVHSPPPFSPDTFPEIKLPETWPVTEYSPPPGPTHAFPVTTPLLIVSDALEMPPPPPYVESLSANVQPVTVSTPP
jgi:hypothetical protein